MFRLSIKNLYKNYFFEFPTAKAIASCHLTKLTNLLKKNSKGKYLKDKAIELKELASKSIGSSNRATAFELQQTIKFIQFLNSEINIIDQKNQRSSR